MLTHFRCRRYVEKMLLHAVHVGQRHATIVGPSWPASDRFATNCLIDRFNGFAASPVPQHQQSAFRPLLPAATHGRTWACCEFAALGSGGCVASLVSILRSLQPLQPLLQSGFYVALDISQAEAMLQRQLSDQFRDTWVSRAIDRPVIKRLSVRMTGHTSISL